jgi:hypothetical protein
MNTEILFKHEGHKGDEGRTHEGKSLFPLGHFVTFVLKFFLCVRFLLAGIIVLSLFGISYDRYQSPSSSLSLSFVCG